MTRFPREGYEYKIQSTGLGSKSFTSALRSALRPDVKVGAGKREYVFISPDSFTTLNGLGLRGGDWTCLFI